MASFATINRRAAERIADLYFESATFMPPVGEPQSCDAYLKMESEPQPTGYDSVADVKKKLIIYRKEQIADSWIEPGAYFTIGETDYVVQSTAEEDDSIFGRVIVKS